MFTTIEETPNYEISETGKIRNKKSMWIIKSRPGGTSPYMVVTLIKDGSPVTRLLHRLIAIAFIPNPDNLKIVHHKDGNKLNNSIDNLEWTTTSKNNQHAYDTGLKKYRPLHYKGKFGKDHNRSVGVLCVTTGQRFGSMSEAERELKIGQSGVSWSIRNNAPINGLQFSRG